MKAIVYTKYGLPDVLQLKEIDKPTPKDDEVLIKVHAVEATKGDCEMRSFNFAVKWFWLPLRFVFGLTKPKRQVLGGYFAGEIESVGKDVSKFKKEDQIFGSTKLQLGAYGEYMCLPASYTLVPKPSNMSFEEAAAVPLGGLNALHFMRKANIRKSEKVLINGAGGSIGTFAVQIAKSMGAEVTAVDSTIKKEMLLQVGSDHFFDYTKEDFSKSGQTYDVIFDMVAKGSYAKCVKALNPKGRYLMGNPRLSDMLRSFLTTRFTDKRAMFVFAGELEEELVALKEMIEEGKLKSIVDKIYPLERAAEAHRRVEAEQRLGIVVLSMGSARDR
ncbi:MAG: NAD(P)-dependent alcohol dehydrogenase [Calditrichaeota bacterium]|nr:NAD(P)-dependent alcohol dehydrogenase [Deltaproteobacteria bacterium]MBT7616549.1 NAD(P)-dependent alcohol dehydrogenase [Calditrichota bacterium]MBT4266780.1 NAD(P)-dependent alcohol dehydrogenase [Deltaproteobacteria bacterium]MBT4643744.1 NAD(P)-dependent alcohol dehydrogenase [Deltaproteobacteria bacterium]MBT7151988.1 NAD(P)-dependent alcohol dehydrogenase [Deltaproteobacteria bacterium]